MKWITRLRDGCSHGQTRNVPACQKRVQTTHINLEPALLSDAVSSWHRATAVFLSVTYPTENIYYAYSCWSFAIDCTTGNEAIVNVQG